MWITNVQVRVSPLFETIKEVLRLVMADYEGKVDLIATGLVKHQQQLTSY